MAQAQFLQNIRDATTDVIAKVYIKTALQLANDATQIINGLKATQLISQNNIDKLKEYEEKASRYASVADAYIKNITPGRSSTQVSSKTAANLAANLASKLFHDINIRPIPLGTTSVNPDIQNFLNAKLKVGLALQYVSKVLQYVANKPTSGGLGEPTVRPSGAPLSRAAPPSGLGRSGSDQDQEHQEHQHQHQEHQQDHQHQHHHQEHHQEHQHQHQHQQATGIYLKLYLLKLKD